MSLSSISQTALSGISAAETMLEVAADNLANLQTPGFKASSVVLATQPSSGTANAQVGHGVQLVGLAHDRSSGVTTTGEGPLNLAIQGAGYFVLEDSQGQRTYTRDGSFQVNSEGQLVSASGDRLLGLQGERSAFQGELVPLFMLNPRARSNRTSAGGSSFAARYHINSHGQIGAETLDGTSRSIGQIRLAQFYNPSGLRAIGQNRFVPTAGSGTAQINDPGSSGLGSLSPAAREASNSDVAENLIDLARAELMFRANLNVLDTVDDLWDELLRGM